jgi:hypothetical protein
VVVQAIAEQYLPRIDNPGGMELVVEDAAGDKYTLRFRCETRCMFALCRCGTERAAAVHVISDHPRASPIFGKQQQTELVLFVL